MVNICLTFLICRNRRAFSFQLENLDKTSSLRRIVRISTKQGWKRNLASKSSKKAGKRGFKQWNNFHVVETWDKQLSKMEEVLIMELVVRNLGFSINKSFQAGKWVANHIQNSTTLKLPASRKRVIQNVCKLICRPPLLF